MGLIKKENIKEAGIRHLKEEILPEEIIPEVEESPAVLEAVRVKAHQIVRQAQHEAAALLEEAKEEGERIKEEARRQGLEQGKRTGEASVGDRLKEALETLNQAVKERKKIIKDSEGEILRLSLKIAEQIIRSEVSLHRDVCLNIASEAIGRVGDRENVIVKVNREDLEHIKKYRDRIAGLVDGVKNLSIIEDNLVEPGGCIIETNVGYVDARISTKLAAVEEAFKKVYQGADESA